MCVRGKEEVSVRSGICVCMYVGGGGEGYVCVSVYTCLYACIYSFFQFHFL